MFRPILLAAALATLPAVAMAQTPSVQPQTDKVPMAAPGSTAPVGAASGAAAGAVGGAIVGGPVGAAIGAVGGAIVGGIAGASTTEFHTYVVAQKHPAYKWEKKVVVGETLPGSGVTYYVVPERFGVKDYRYTVVNDQVVLVEPGTRRIVQIIN